MNAPLKAKGWWNYKIPPMLAVAYFAIGTAPSPPRLASMILPIAGYIIAVIGIAGFGHFFLDIFDVEEDLKLGKSNLWLPLSPLQRFATFTLLIAASTLPWLLFSMNNVAVALITLEFVMFILYAVPPIRLKDRGFAGLTADAMYAHVLPALWTWVPFSLISGSAAPREFPFVLAVWAFPVGVRHLLQHQVIQLDEDTVAGARTHAVRWGRDSSLRLIVNWLMPLEFVAFAALLALIGKSAPLIPVVFVVYAAWQVSKFRFLWLSRLNLLGSLADSDRVTIAGTLMMTRFYERWLPVLLAANLAIKFPEYTPLVLAHLLLFRTFFRDTAQDLLLLRAHLRALGGRASKAAE